MVGDEVYHGEGSGEGERVWEVTESRVEGGRIRLTAERNFHFKMSNMDKFLTFIDIRDPRHFRLGLTKPWLIGFQEEGKKPISTGLLEMRWESGFV